MLVADISNGLEPVHIPIVLDAAFVKAGGALPPLPKLTYMEDYNRVTARAATFIGKYASDGLLQWAGSRRTKGAAPALFKNTVPNSVQYNGFGLLEAQWHHTPLVECDDVSCKPRLLKCAPSAMKFFSKSS